MAMAPRGHGGEGVIPPMGDYPRQKFKPPVVNACRLPMGSTSQCVKAVNKFLVGLLLSDDNVTFMTKQS